MNAPERTRDHVEEFLTLWDSGPAPDVWKYLAERRPELDLDAWLEIVLCDQARRRRSECPTVEEYCATAPAPVDRPRLMDVVWGDYRRRKTHGETIDPAEYYRRFPELADELRRHLALGTWLDSAADDADVTYGGIAVSDEGDNSDEDEAPLPFSDFQLTRRIGGGGMGEVFEASQRSLRRKVAVKTILPQFVADEQIRRRFLREARITAQLRHPNIATVYGVGRGADGGLFLAMELIDGRSVDTPVAAGRLGVDEAVRIVAAAAQAIGYAHGRGVIHRDLKPANVLIDDDGRVVVVDFGLARSLVLEEPALSTASQLIGTPAYLAPEQIDGRLGEPGKGLDIYGLGAILFALLTGRAPHNSRSLGELLRDIQDRAVERLDVIRGDVSPELADVCAKALSKRPADRQPSAEEFLRELRAAAKARPVGDAHPATTAAAGVPKPRPPVARRTVLAGVVAGLLIGGYFAVEAWRNGSAAAMPPAKWTVTVFREGRLEHAEPFLEHPAPLRTGDSVRIRIELSRPCLPYVFWTDFRGNLTPLASPKTYGARLVEGLTLPTNSNNGLPIVGTAGWEMCLVVLRDTAVPDDWNWQAALRLPVDPTWNPRFAALDERPLDVSRPAKTESPESRLAGNSRNVGDESPLKSDSAAAALAIWRNSLPRDLGAVYYLAVPHQ